MNFSIAIYIRTNRTIVAVIKRSRLISRPMPLRYLARRDYEPGSLGCDGHSARDLLVIAIVCSPYREEHGSGRYL